MFAWGISAGAAAPESKPRFTVSDSIELERFIEPEPTPGGTVGVFSPDGSRFVVVTQRGVLASNRLRATVWLFESAAVDNTAAGAVPPSPRPLAVLEGRTSPADNNEALNVVRLLSWSDDGRALMFLARTGRVDWRLCQVNISTGVIQPMTPEGQNVGYYTQGHGLTVYSVAPRQLAPEPDAVVVGTGRSLGSLLFPVEDVPDVAALEELWTLSAGRSRQVVDPDTGGAVLVRYDVHDPRATGFSLSPDARSLVATRTVTRIPTRWEEYTPRLAAWRMEAATNDQLSHQRLVPEQFVLVDLQSGRVASMFDAPLGRSAGWFEAAAQTLWSTDGREVLVTNTFVPSNGSAVAAAGGNFRVPQIVTYDVGLHRWLDVAPVEDVAPREPVPRHAVAVEWKSGKREVEVVYGARAAAATVTKRYRLVGPKWRQVSLKFVLRPAEEWVRAAGRERPRIVVRQGLNEAPALFIADSDGRAREIWNPNPRMADFRFGTAERYRWLDRRGRSVNGVLFKPEGYQEGKRYPLVIEARSYSQDRFVVDGTYATAVAARAMAASGLLVLQAGEPQLPTDATAMDHLAASLEAYQAAIVQLSAAGLADAAQVGLIGFSRTCINVIYALTKDPTRFAAATIANGMVYGFFQYFAFLDADANDLGLEQYRELYGGAPFGAPLSRYLADSPVFNLHKVTAAVRVETHSAENLFYDWETYGGLRAQHKPVDLIILPHASHVVSMPADVLQSQEGDLEWFRFWLQGYESTNPASAAQYRRWEALCDLQLAGEAAHPGTCVPSSR